MTSLDTSPRVGWVPCSIACAVLGCCFLLALDPDGVRAPGNQPSHRYSSHDPSWTQLAFPRLGAVAAPPTSATTLTSRVVRSIPVGTELPRLALVAAAAHILALVLFSVALVQLGVGPAVAAIAVVALGLQPAFFAAATTWTPYVMLPSLVLGVIVARARWVEIRRTRWLVLLTATLLCAVAESMYAIALVPSLLWGLGMRRTRTALALAAAVGIGGLSLQVVGAALAWRDASALEIGQIPSWWEALVAVTSRWFRLLEIYLTSSGPETLQRLRHAASQVGLLGLMLAVVGMFSLFRDRRREASLLVSLMLVAFAIESLLVPPVSAMSPAGVLLVLVVLILAACGVAQMALAFRSPAPAIVFFGVVLASHGLPARRLNDIDVGARSMATLRDALAVLPHPASLVATNVEIDRRVEYVMNKLPASGRIIRIPQTLAAIRQANRPGSPVFVWPSDVARVSSLGWMLAPHYTSHDPNGQGVFFYEVIDATACAQLRGDRWFDITAPAYAGAISVQADRDSRYEIEIEADGIASGPVHAEDVEAGATLDTIGSDLEHFRLAVEWPRRSLPRILFDVVPSRARARIQGAEATQSVRVCGSPVRGEAIRLVHLGDDVSLPLQSEAIFVEGWHSAEPAGSGDALRRWSNTTSATALVQLPVASAPLEVSIQAASAVPADRSPTLALEINGHALGRRAMSPGSTTYTWTVASDVVRRGLNVFRLDVPEVISPRSLGISQDARSLGIALTAFRLRRLGG